MSLNSTFAKSIFNTERFQTDNNLLKDGQTATSTDKSKTDGKNPIIGKATVSLENKPPEMPLGEHLKRQALNKIAADYGLRSEDVELEIQYIKEKSGGNFINDLSFGETQVKNPNDLTDLQVADLIKNGHKTVEFGIHQATIERMVKRDELVKWLAQKDEFGIGISDQDKADLAEMGYTTDDLAKFRDAKYMSYLGSRSQARTESETRFKTLNDELRQKMVAEKLNELESRPDSDFYGDGGNQKTNPDFERRRLANAAVNNLLGDKTPFEYERDRTDAESLEKRLADKTYGEYLSSGSKTLINSFYFSLGDSLKGVAVLANGIRRYDEDGNRLNTKASDALIYKIGEWMQQDVQAPGVDKDIEKTPLGGTLPRTVGGFLPYLLGGWATSSPKATVAVLAGLSTGGSIYDEAKSHDATELQAQKAGLLTGGFVGVTSIFGYGKTLETLETLNSGVGAAAWKTIFSEAIKDGGRNAIIAGGQTIFENGVAKQTYDPNRSYLENIQERMIAAGITGATLKGGLEIIAKVRMGKNPQILAETQKILKVKPETETLTPKQIELKNSGSALKAKLNEKLNGLTKIENNSQKPIKYKTKEMLQQYAGEETGKVWGTKVKYLSEEERSSLELIVKDGKIVDTSGNLYDTSSSSSVFGAGQGKAIFVMDQYGKIYASKYQSVGKFHHSSILGGKSVAAAGEITIKNGVIVEISNRSGHYQPSQQMNSQIINELKSRGIDVSNIKITGF